MTLVDERPECNQSGCGLRRVLLVVLWLLPMASMFALVWRYGVDVPFMDDFSVAISLNRYASVGLTWADLNALANESRIIFPRLLFIALAQFTRWDPRYQMACAVIVVELTACALLVITRRTIKNRAAVFAVAMLINLLLFCPVQWENFLFSIQLVYFVPALSLAVVIAVMGSQLGIWLATPIAIVAALVATYSYANGMAVWILAIPLFLFHSSRHHLWALALWLVVTAVTLRCYFHGYVKPPQNPSMMIALAHPVDTMWFYLAFLGNALRTEENARWAVALGAPALGLWALGGIYVLLVARDRAVFDRALPWMILGAYSVMSGAVTAVGRVGFGLASSMTPRYPTFALPLWISLVPLWAVIFQHRIRRGEMRPTTAGGILICIAGLILGFSIKGDLFIREEMLDFASLQLATRATIQFSQVVPEDEAIQGVVFPDAVSVKLWMKLLDDRDQMHAGLFRTNDISAIEVKDNAALAGSFDRFALLGHSFELGGWAILPPEKRRADAVLLTTPDADGVERIVGMVEDYRLRDRPDVAAALHAPWASQCGWIKGLDQSKLPAGAMITAWAYDTWGRKAYRLMNPKPVPG